jgi:hypothetical protein
VESLERETLLRSLGVFNGLDSGISAATSASAA